MNYIMKLVISCLGFVLVASILYADIPNTINYQGRLMNSSSQPVTDGQYNIILRLYTALSGGTMEWEESQQVLVSNGYFNTVLGNATALTPSIFNQPLWISTQIGSDLELSPRQKLGTAAYAMNVADGAITTTKIVNGAVTAEKIAAGAVGTAMTSDGSITTEKLADSVVTAVKVANGSITTEKIVNSAVNSDKIASQAITTDKLANDVVTSQKITSGAVTNSWNVSFKHPLLRTNVDTWSTIYSFEINVSGGSLLVVVNYSLWAESAAARSKLRLRLNNDYHVPNELGNYFYLDEPNHHMTTGFNGFIKDAVEGHYTVTLEWQRPLSSGGLRIDGGDPISISIIEFKK